MYFSVVASLLLLATSFVSAEFQPSAQTLAQNDIAVLQYALLLENLEYTFYNTYQAQFTASDFESIGLTSNDYSLFNLIRDHERSHVELLSSVVPNPGNCTYNFGVNTVSDYIKVARVLENTGVSAYDGAINNFYSPAFAQIAATIATIEARHASYLNNLNHVSPFPSAFDNATAPAVIAGALFNTQGSIATCQFAAGFVLPQFYTVYPVQNASDPSQPTPANLLANDIKVLNYALFLEHLEAEFYAFVLQNFSASQFGSNVTYSYIQAIASHEATHVTALTNIINQLGGSPIAACQYNFAGAINGNISTALTIAAALEATGVGAYDGAVNAINNAQLKEAAATIATVEARHASYINYVINNAQGPVQGAGGAYDIALTFNNVTGIVMSTNLIVSCPAGPQAFSVLIVQPYTNATFNSNTANSTTGASTTGAVTTGAATTGAATTGAATTGAATTGTVTTGATTSTPAPAPTPSPSATTGSVTTGTPTATPSTTASATGASTTTAGTTTAGATTRGPTSTTSGASIASASVVVVVALLVAVAAF